MRDLNTPLAKGVAFFFLDVRSGRLQGGTRRSAAGVRGVTPRMHLRRHGPLVRLLEGWVEGEGRAWTVCVALTEVCDSSESIYLSQQNAFVF